MQEKYECKFIRDKVNSIDSSYVDYGNTGCGVFQTVGTKLERLCLRINILKGNYWTLSNFGDYWRWQVCMNELPVKRQITLNSSIFEYVLLSGFLPMAGQISETNFIDLGDKKEHTNFRKEFGYSDHSVLVRTWVRLHLIQFLNSHFCDN